MMNKKMSVEEKMAMLKEAGIDVNDMIQFLAEDGFMITVEIPKEDPILEKIKADGYLHNPMLFRRWIMAQMFYMLKYKSYAYDYRYPVETGYNGYIDEVLTWDYQIKFLIDEVTRIVKIHKKGGDATEYTRLCTPQIVINICKEIYEATEKYYKGDNSPWMQDKVTRLRFAYQDLQYTWSYARLIPLLHNFRRNMISLPNNKVKKVQAFKDMYKGIGAYWTSKNMIMFHNCRVPGMDQYESMKMLETKTLTYADPNGGKGWKLLGFMKLLIEANDFDFYDRMREIYRNK